jgi:hypothetical protein
LQIKYKEIQKQYISEYGSSCSHGAIQNHIRKGKTAREKYHFKKWQQKVPPLTSLDKRNRIHNKYSSLLYLTKKTSLLIGISLHSPKG